MKIFDIFRKREISEADKEWNLFINEICSRNLNTLNKIQRNAVLCFWYDAEMNSGGHSGYFDCYREINTDILYNAIKEVANNEIANNFKNALNLGIDDDYISTDMAYYNFRPSLCDFLKDYVENNKEKIFE